METSSPPHPTIDLSTHLYYQLVCTLTGLLPPPLDDTPEALHTRNHAAIPKVAALLPVNATESLKKNAHLPHCRQENGNDSRLHSFQVRLILAL